MKTFRLAYLPILALMFVALLPSIIEHTLWLMGGEGLPHILVGRWDHALINIVFFCVFLAFVIYRKKVDWRSKGIYSAFIIALFAEMYGFPLTAYFMANYFGAIDVDYRPAYVLKVRFLDVWFELPTMMIVGGLITIVGLSLIVLGWIKIYKNREELATNGLYRYSRHPQYVGILLVTFGWILHWPTLLTVLMWPVLAVSYYKLARSEEQYLKEKFPVEFEKYRKETPMFI